MPVCLQFNHSKNMVCLLTWFCSVKSLNRTQGSLEFRPLTSMVVGIRDFRSSTCFHTLPGPSRTSLGPSSGPPPAQCVPARLRRPRVRRRTSVGQEKKTIVVRHFEEVRKREVCRAGARCGGQWLFQMEETDTHES